MHWIMDPNPAFFISGFRDTNKKQVFALILTEERRFIFCTTFFKDNKSLRIHKTVSNQGISTFFCLLIEGSGAAQIIP
jgi:hypothetical protein